MLTDFELRMVSSAARQLYEVKTILDDVICNHNNGDNNYYDFALREYEELDEVGKLLKFYNSQAQVVREMADIILKMYADRGIDC